jgi:hypothetical protein
MPSVDRRNRLSTTEVILQFSNNSNSNNTNNNHESSEEEDNNEDGNGNESQLCVAEISRHSISSSPADLAQQNDERVRRQPVRSSPSPVLTRKVYDSKAEARLTSSEDEDDEEEEAENESRQGEDGDVASRRSPAGEVAGGATSSPSSVPRQCATRSESPKPTKSGNQSADVVSSMIVTACGYRVHGSSDSRVLTRQYGLRRKADSESHFVCRRWQ